MKLLCCPWSKAALMLASLSLFFVWAAQARQPVVLEVEYAAICRSIEDREPVDPGTVFPDSVGKLYCFTKIIGADGPVDIIHVWYCGDTERARVTLTVQSSPWRTYSSKIIQPGEIGQWHVDVLSPSEDILKTIHFSLVP
jgi:hypothetical protein